MEDANTSKPRHVAVWGRMIEDNARVLYGYLQAMEDEGLIEFIDCGSASELVFEKDQELHRILKEWAKGIQPPIDVGFCVGCQTVYRAYVRDEEKLVKRLDTLKKRFEMPHLGLDLETRIYS